MTGVFVAPDHAIRCDMDSLVTAAARALKAGDPLGALKWIALRHDAPALALRGIAMAQPGELAKAKVLLRRAARSFGPRARVECARCVTAEAEVALASRDLRWPTHALDEARRTFGAANYRSFAPTPVPSTLDYRLRLR